MHFFFQQLKSLLLQDQSFLSPKDMYFNGLREYFNSWCFAVFTQYSYCPVLTGVFKDRRNAEGVVPVLFLKNFTKLVISLNPN